MRHNFLLQEAVSNGFDAKKYADAFKKQLNLCNLTKFRSTGECAVFYSAFFGNQLEEDNLTFLQWMEVYGQLLRDDSFCSKLAMYMAVFQPADYAGMFAPLMALVDSESRTMESKKIRYLSDAKANFQFMQTRFDSIGETIKAQVADPTVILFITTVNQVLQNYIFYLNNQLQLAIDGSRDENELTYVVHTPITEAVLSPEGEELIRLLETGDRWIQGQIAKETSAPMNEGIINTAKEAAKMASVAAKKAVQAFDDRCAKKVRELQQNRRNRKHAEMVGEALRINHELKRLLKSLAWGMLNPAWGVLRWVISVVWDRETDKKDRDILIGQLKDELEIIEEKIQTAERNGDDKSKIELIRLRQKLNHEYERINKVRFDPNKH